MKSHRWMACVAVTLVASIPFTLLIARAQDSVELSFFEHQVPASLALQASQAGVDADQANVTSVGARNGTQVFATGEIGPRRDVVTTDVIRDFNYIGQTVGVRLPIWGTRAVERENLISADLQQKVAQIDMQIQQQQIVDKVREAYINYWMSYTNEQAAVSVIAQLRGNGPATAALRKDGFWTEADSLRYTDLMIKATTDQAHDDTQQRDSINQLGLLTSSVVSPFTPVQPNYAACQPLASFAVDSSYKNDLELQKLAIQQQGLQAMLPLQHSKGVNANVDIGVHGYYENPGGTGYGGFVGLDVGAPLHEAVAEHNETEQIRAELRQVDLLAQARQNELKTGIMVAIADRGQAQKELAMAQFDRKSVAEDLRETEVRFANVSPDSLTEAQAKMQTAYLAQVASVNAQAQILQSTRELLFLAPEACSTRVATKQQGR